MKNIPEIVSPYARRLFHQMAVPEVDQIDGLPPAVALQQQRGSPTSRSSVGSVTTSSNLLRMLYSRAGHYPPGQALLYAESFSTNTPEGACQLPWILADTREDCAGAHGTYSESAYQAGTREHFTQLEAFVTIHFNTVELKCSFLFVANVATVKPGCVR